MTQVQDRPNETSSTTTSARTSASLRASGAIARATPYLMNGAMMAEPATSAAGGFAVWKLGAGLLGVGVVATTLGFLVRWPKTGREALVRVAATMIGSFFFGPFAALAAYVRMPEFFAAGAQLAARFGYPPEAGLLMAAVPFICLAGLPFWWLLGGFVLWFERRQGKDIGEMGRDAKADVQAVVLP